MSEILNPTGPYSIITRKPTLLAIGGISAYGEDLSKFGFIISVAKEFYEPKHLVMPGGSTVLFAELNDYEGDITPMVPEVLRAVGLLRAARAAGHNALVTCAAGRNRSGLVIAEYLISSGVNANKAITTIQERRKDALTNRTFVKWLKRKR